MNTTTTAPLECAWAPDVLVDVAQLVGRNSADAAQLVCSRWRRVLAAAAHRLPLHPLSALHMCASGALELHVWRPPCADCQRRNRCASMCAHGLRVARISDPERDAPLLRSLAHVNFARARIDLYHPSYAEESEVDAARRRRRDFVRRVLETARRVHATRLSVELAADDAALFATLDSHVRAKHLLLHTPPHVDGRGAVVFALAPFYAELVRAPLLRTAPRTSLHPGSATSFFGRRDTAKESADELFEALGTSPAPHANRLHVHMPAFTRHLFARWYALCVVSDADLTRVPGRIGGEAGARAHGAVMTELERRHGPPTQRVVRHELGREWRVAEFVVRRTPQHIVAVRFRLLSAAAVHCAPPEVQCVAGGHVDLCVSVVGDE